MLAIAGLICWNQIADLVPGPNHDILVVVTNLVNATTSVVIISSDIIFY